MLNWAAILIHKIIKQCSAKISPLSVLAGSGSMSSTEETLEARSATREREVGRSRAFTAAAKREWQRESSALLCRVLDMSFFMTAIMSPTSQGGATKIAYNTHQPYMNCCACTRPPHNVTNPIAIVSAITTSKYAR